MYCVLYFTATRLIEASWGDLTQQLNTHCFRVADHPNVLKVDSVFILTKLSSSRFIRTWIQQRLTSQVSSIKPNVSNNMVFNVVWTQAANNIVYSWPSYDLNQKISVWTRPDKVFNAFGTFGQFFILHVVDTFRLALQQYWDFAVLL